MGVGICQNNIGNIHMKLGDYLEAISFYEKAVAIAER